MRSVIAVVVVLAVASGVAEGQPSARVIEAARVATGMKCLTTGAFAAQTLNTREEPRMVPVRRTTRGGLGLGALDASEGMSRPPMVARQEVEPSCTPVVPKARGVDSAVVPPMPR